MTQVYPFSPRTDSVEAGLQFEDFGAETMARELLWPIRINRSRKSQFEHGDSKVVEFKRDDTMTGYPPARFASGRASIEIEERTSSPIWTPGGIFARSVPHLYAHGNPDLFFIFETRRLRDYFERISPEVFEHPPDHPTVRKFYIPLPQAMRMAIWIFEKGELKPLEAVTLPDFAVKPPLWTGTSPRTLAADVRKASSFKKQAGWEDAPWQLYRARLVEAATCIEVLSRGDGA
jgi:hypothetical protein